MRFSLHSPARDADQVTRRAEAAEALGFHALFFADGHLNNLDGFQAMTVCALRTERLRFGIAATTMAYRDPTTLALSAATSNEFSRGRAILGLGTGDGSTYRLGRKATRLADFAAGLATIRALLQEDVPSRCPGATRARARSPSPPASSRYRSTWPPRGPRSLRVAGRYADGIMLGTGFDLDVQTARGTGGSRAHHGLPAAALRHRRDAGRMRGAHPGAGRSRHIARAADSSQPRLRRGHGSLGARGHPGLRRRRLVCGVSQISITNSDSDFVVKSRS